MKRRSGDRRPGRLRGGALLWALAPALVIGCARDEDAAVEHLGPDPELREALGLSGTEDLHRVVLGGRGSTEHVVPSRIDVGVGALVEFVTADRRMHVVSFPTDSLTPDGARFLESTGQLVSPPLLERGTRFVVSFRDAPPGRYPFLSEGPGEPAAGVVVVRPRP